MKDYKEIASSVFQRRDEYLEEKKRKKAIFIKSTAAALSCCVMLLVGFGIWRSDLLKQISPTHDDSRYNVTEATVTATTADSTVTTTTGKAAAADTVTSATNSTTSTGTNDKNTATNTKAATPVNTGRTTASSAVNHGSSVRTTDSSMEITSPRRTTSGTTAARTTAAYERTTTARTSTTYYYTTIMHTSTTHYYTSTAYISTTRYYTTSMRTYTTYRRTTTTHATTTRTWTTMTYQQHTTLYTTTMADCGTTTWRIDPIPLTTGTTTTVQYTRTGANTTETTTHPDYFIANGRRYNITHTTAYPQEPQTWLYYDVMEAEGDIWAIDVYKYGDLDPDLVCSASFDRGNTYCIGIYSDFSSPDLGSALNSMDFDGIMTVGDLNIIDEGSYPIDKGRLLELLGPYKKTSELWGANPYLADVRNAIDTGQPVPELDISDFKAYMTLTLPDITGPGHYYPSGYLAFTRYGYITFEVTGTKRTHYIGSEAADRILRELIS